MKALPLLEPSHFTLKFGFLSQFFDKECSKTTAIEFEREAVLKDFSLKSEG